MVIWLRMNETSHGAKGCENTGWDKLLILQYTAILLFLAVRHGGFWHRYLFVVLKPKHLALCSHSRIVLFLAVQFSAS